MSQDIRPILNEWPYRPDEVTVRSLTGEDGKELIQLRLDLGVLQMQIDGRPDGQQVKGSDSWLDYHKARQQENDSANPDGAPYLLDTEDCTELMREAAQYYHRYISLWQLKRYELCARDTERNLRLFRFVRSHAKHERDKVQFDQWRPYVTMMHARAVATPLVELRQYESALGAIDAGIRGLERFLADYGQEEQAERMSEMLFLKRWRKEIRGQAGESLPAEEDEGEDDPFIELNDKLATAIREERYEDAAELRDELRRLENPPPPGSAGGPPGSPS